MNQEKKSKKKLQESPVYEISLKFSNNLFQAYLFEIFENMNINLSPVEIVLDEIELTDVIKIKYNNEFHFIYFFDKSKISNIPNLMTKTFFNLDSMLKHSPSKNILLIFFQIPQNFEFEQSSKDDLIFFFISELKIKVMEFSTNNDLVEFLSNFSDSITTKEEKSKITFFDAKPVTITNLCDIENITDEDSKMFIKHLMCIPGISDKKAVSISKCYPTLSSLMAIYSSFEYNEKEKENFLSDIQIIDKSKNSSKKLGNALSNKIYKFFYTADQETIIS